MKKLFVSYSHKDEAFREDLEEHLTMMSREGVISIWHDRKILAGQEWKGQIDDNLEQADIVIFMVSPSFLASDYCFDVEVARALEKKEHGSAEIISIIIRPCDWAAAKFSKYQAVPTDAKAVSTWDNKDEAWLDAVLKIKSHLKNFTPKPADKVGLDYLKNTLEEPRVSNSFVEWLDDTEILLTHRKADKVKLSDIFVAPDFEDSQDGADICILDFWSIFNKPGLYLISGDEQQGKTTLLKYLFREMSKLNYISAYVDASDISSSDVTRLQRKIVSEQYAELTIDEYISYKKKIILIDNIDAIGLNAKYRGAFLDAISSGYDYVVATCHNSFRFVAGEIPALDDYLRYEMLGFGNLKRSEIVKKWISLGEEETIEDSDLYSRCDDLKAWLDTAIKKNVVPAKPIYVLMMMQMFEAGAQLNLDLTSYGHCYQQLIYRAFDQAKINRRDYDKYLNVLTELSWLIFKRQEDPNDTQLDEFFAEYCKRYLAVNKEEIIDKLTGCSIISKNGARTKFKYAYIYYFFVGKKIAESYADCEQTKLDVRSLLNSLHREDFANILIFITHHTKDSWVIDSIKEVLSSLYADQERAALTRQQLMFMGEFVRAIPELVIEQREIQSSRDDRDKRLDQMERRNDDYEISPSDILANINKTFKGMEVAGQIIRNRHAAMTKDSLYELANSGASAGLRFLDYFIKISDSAKNEIIKMIEFQLLEHPGQTDRQIQLMAESFYLHMTYGVISGLIKKIATSIGSREAEEIYNILEQKEGTPSFVLIRQAIELQFTKGLRIESIQATAEALRSNPVCLRILRELVIQHIYMFPTTYKIKQQLAEMLKIPIKGQLMLEQEKRTKK